MTDQLTQATILSHNEGRQDRAPEESAAGAIQAEEVKTIQNSIEYKVYLMSNDNTMGILANCKSTRRSWSMQIVGETPIDNGPSRHGGREMIDITTLFHMIKDFIQGNHHEFFLVEFPITPKDTEGNTRLLIVVNLLSAYDRLTKRIMLSLSETDIDATHRLEQLIGDRITEIGEISRKLDEQGEFVHELAEGHDARIAAVVGITEEHSKKLAEIKDKQDEVIKKLEHDLEESTKRIETLTVGQTESNKRIEALTASCADLQAKIAEANKCVAAKKYTDAKVNELGSTLASVKGRVEQIAAKAAPAPAPAPAPAVEAKAE